MICEGALLVEGQDVEAATRAETLWGRDITFPIQENL
jgi:hypothetical protein